MDLANMYRLLRHEAQAAPNRDEGEFFVLSFVAATLLTDRHPFIQKLKDYRDEPFAWPTLADELVKMRCPEYWVNTLRANGQIFVQLGRQARGTEEPRFPGNAFVIYKAGGVGFLSETCAKLAVLAEHELTSQGIEPDGYMRQIEATPVGASGPRITQQEPHSRFALYANQLLPVSELATDPIAEKVDAVRDDPRLTISTLAELAALFPHRPHTLVPTSGTSAAPQVDFDYADDPFGPLPALKPLTTRRVGLAPPVQAVKHV